MPNAQGLVNKAATKTQDISNNLSSHVQESMKTDSSSPASILKNKPNSQGPLDKAAAQTQDITHSLSSQIDDISNKMSNQQEPPRDSGSTKNASYATSLPNYPVTALRKPFKPTDNSPLTDAGTARANYAPTVESPNGTTENNYAKEHAHETVSLFLLLSLSHPIHHSKVFLTAARPPGHRPACRLLGHRQRRRDLAAGHIPRMP